VTGLPIGKTPLPPLLPLPRRLEADDEPLSAAELFLLCLRLREAKEGGGGARWDDWERSSSCCCGVRVANRFSWLIGRERRAMVCSEVGLLH
jgi:hypothetical protein